MAVLEPVLADWQGFFREAKEGPPAWKSKGICAGLDPEMFHPRRGEGEEAAKAICAQCPVQAECLEYALANVMRVGVWGGASERERRMIRRERHTARALGITIEEAREIVQAQISEATPARRLRQRFGYTEEQATVVLARPGVLVSHASAVARARLTKRSEIAAAPLHLRGLMRRFGYTQAQAESVYARCRGRVA